jgi:hypothetical protein
MTATKNRFFASLHRKLPYPVIPSASEESAFSVLPRKTDSSLALCRNSARNSCGINDIVQNESRRVSCPIVGSRKAVNALQKLIWQLPELERVAY